MLYSIGKDSSVLLRLAQKAFYPEPIPFPLLHGCGMTTAEELFPSGPPPNLTCPPSLRYPGFFAVEARRPTVAGLEFR